MVTSTTMSQYDTICGLILLACAIIGATGNVLVLIVISHNRGLQNVTQILIANLSAAHFLLSALCLPLEAAFLLGDAAWLSDIIMCKVVHFFNSVFSSAAILTLAAIAIDRYFSVVFPLEKKVSLGKGRLMVIYTWIHSVLISIPKLFLCVVWQISPPDRPCTSWPPLQVYLVTYVLLTLVLPLVITIVAYILVWRGFRTSQRKVNIQKKARKLHASKTDVHLLKMLTFMVFCFVVLWAPQVTYLFLRHFNATAQLSGYFALTALWICKIQPVVDPITYGYLNKQFRKNLRQVVRSCSVRCTSDLSMDDGLSVDNSHTPSSQPDGNNHGDETPIPGTSDVQKSTLVAGDCIAVERSYNQCNAYSVTIQADVHRFKKVETRMYSEKGGVYTGSLARASRGLPEAASITDGGVYAGPPASSDILSDHGGIYTGPEMTTAGGVYVGPTSSGADVVLTALSSIPTPARPSSTQNSNIKTTVSGAVVIQPRIPEERSESRSGSKKRRRTGSMLGKLKDKRASQIAPTVELSEQVATTKVEHILPDARTRSFDISSSHHQAAASKKSSHFPLGRLPPLGPSSLPLSPASLSATPLFRMSNLTDMRSTQTIANETKPRRRKRSKILHKRLEERKRKELEKLDGRQIMTY